MASAPLAEKGQGMKDQKKPGRLAQVDPAKEFTAKKFYRPVFLMR